MLSSLSLSCIFHQRIVFVNEYLNGSYSAGSYCFSLLLASIPFHLLTAFIYQTVVWFMVGYHTGPNSRVEFEGWLFSVLSAFIMLIMMESISLLLVEHIPDAMLSTTLTMVCLGMLFLFPGFFIPLDQMVRPIFWLGWIMPSKYALDSQLWNAFNRQEFTMGKNGIISGDILIKSAFSMEQYGDSITNVTWGFWAVILGFMLFFRFVHFLSIKFHFRHFSAKSVD